MSSATVNTLFAINISYVGQDTSGETESFEIGATGIRRKDMPNYPIITRDSAKVLIETYDTLIENKSNYISIMNMRCSQIYDSLPETSWRTAAIWTLLRSSKVWFVSAFIYPCKRRHCRRKERSVLFHKIF